MSIQTNFTFKSNNAVDGMIYGLGASTIATAIPTESIPFGLAVVGTTSSGNEESNGRRFVKKLTDSSTESFVGVACHRHIEPTPEKTGIGTVDSNATTQWESGDAMALLKQGMIWVPVTEAVSPTSSVVVNETSSDFSTATGLDISGMASFVTSTSGAGLAVLEVNIS